ncbi:MAG: hypothetical protein ACJ790_03515 [Myxococcaceae bacterium]
MANERELFEEATTAFRAQNADGSVRPHPAWMDLSEDDRERLFEETLRVREIEKALDPAGMSTTAKLILRRIKRQSP